MNRSTILKYLAIISGPLLALFIILGCDLNPQNREVTYMAAIVVWVAAWWFTEAVSIAIASLVPFIMMPILGIGTAKEVAQQYTDSIIFLFIGGFMLAFAIEKWGLHKRIALKILSVVGSSPAKILMGVMLSTYLISNWISNTATTIMLFSAVLALISELKVHIHKGETKIAAALLLGLAFAATIGGMATPAGTPTNMILFKAYAQAYPDNHDLNFLSWSKIGFPLSFLFLTCTYLVLYYYFIKNKVVLDISKSHFKNNLHSLGKMTFEEITVMFLFLIAVILWFTREDIVVGSFHYKGWNHLFKTSKSVDEGIVAIIIATLLFIIPSKQKKDEALLEWEDAKKIRYDIILLFGGGFALAYGAEKAHLIDWVAQSLEVFKGFPVFILVVCICAIVALISEFASNIASIQLCLPVMIALVAKLGIPPLQLLMPATFAASIGFMLPVATAANTIVFGTKQIHLKDMYKVGFVLDIIGILLISVFTYLYFN